MNLQTDCRSHLSSSVLPGGITTPTCLLTTIQTLGLCMKRCLCSHWRTLISLILSSFFSLSPSVSRLESRFGMWSFERHRDSERPNGHQATYPHFVFIQSWLPRSVSECAHVCSDTSEGCDESLVGSSNGLGADSLRPAPWATLRHTSTGAKAVQNEIQLK